MKIAVLTDSSADISIKEAKEKGLHVIRFPLIIDNEDYIEEETITVEEFTKKMYGGSLAKTSQPSVGALFKKWDGLLKEYDHIIYAAISTGISGAYNTALGQSRNYEGKVTVINTCYVAYPMQILCDEIKTMIKLGYTPNEIKEKIESSEKMDAILIPGDLQYLKRGGRISPQAASLANLLKIVPLLQVAEGKIDAYEKVRTTKKAYDVAFKYFEERTDNYSEYYWYVVHADCETLGKEMQERLATLTGQEVVLKKIFPVIMAHTGPGSVGIGRSKKRI